MSASPQYWLKPKKIICDDAQVWWYADDRGSLDIHVRRPGVPHIRFKIRAAELRNFINMLDHHKR